MQYLICCVPVSPMRAAPSHHSEMVSQQLFGEESILIETQGIWNKIQLKYDGYQGWVTQEHILSLTREDFISSNQAMSIDLISTIIYDGVEMKIPMGSSLKCFRNGKAVWNKKEITYDGEMWKPDSITIDESLIRKIAFPFLNTSYLWGGKSIFGIDCSGFSQTVYKFLHIPISRDASQQATQGEAVNSLADGRCGDLAFFNNEEGRITHVGILLNNHEIIHSSGKVKIDTIDTEGIISADTLQRTHRLKIIKRFF